MSLLFESIRVQDGVLHRIEMHEERMSRTREELFLRTDVLPIRSIVVPEEARTGVFKCRVYYGEEIDSIEFLPYRVEIPEHFQIVEDDEIEYPYKYMDRERLDALAARVAPDGLIIARNGLITETWGANLIFFDGHRWVTPARCLLRGTMREWLLREGAIQIADIPVQDIRKYHSFKLISAMLPPDLSPEIPVAAIR